jgi:hypothetical protein
MRTKFVVYDLRGQGSSKQLDMTQRCPKFLSKILVGSGCIPILRASIALAPPHFCIARGISRAQNSNLVLIEANKSDCSIRALETETGMTYFQR